jgi:hypothetical protein
MRNIHKASSDLSSRNSPSLHYHCPKGTKVHIDQAPNVNSQLNLSINPQLVQNLTRPPLNQIALPLILKSPRSTPQQKPEASLQFILFL